MEKKAAVCIYPSGSVSVSGTPIPCSGSMTKLRPYEMLSRPPVDSEPATRPGDLTSDSFRLKQVSRTYHFGL